MINNNKKNEVLEELDFDVSPYDEHSSISYTKNNFDNFLENKYQK